MADRAPKWRCRAAMEKKAAFHRGRKGIGIRFADEFLFPSLPPAYRHARSVNGFAVLHCVSPLRVTAAARADALEVSGRGTSFRLRRVRSTLAASIEQGTAIFRPKGRFSGIMGNEIRSNGELMPDHRPFPRSRRREPRPAGAIFPKLPVRQSVQNLPGTGFTDADRPLLSAVYELGRVSG